MAGRGKGPVRLTAAVHRGDAARSLGLLRDLLARELEAQQVEHDPECSCECGQPAGDPGKIVQLTKALAAMFKIDSPAAAVKPPQSVPDQLRQRREQRRAGR